MVQENGFHNACGLLAAVAELVPASAEDLAANTGQDPKVIRRASRKLVDSNWLVAMKTGMVSSQQTRYRLIPAGTGLVNDLTQ